MAEREKYYIAMDGQVFEVSRELYEAYYKGQRKDKYFTHDLKEEHMRVDKETGQITIIPSREDSYERLLETEKQLGIARTTLQSRKYKILEKLKNLL